MFTFVSSCERALQTTHRIWTKRVWLTFCLHFLDDPSVGLENGELIIPGHVLRHEVFDPVIHQVLRAIHSHSRSSRIRVSTLLLVGGFSTNEYLFQRIKGAARSGLYPTVTSVIPSQSVVMRVRLPAEAEDKRMRPAYITTSGGMHFCENRLQYIIKKGVGVQKGSRVETELRKFSAAPYDSIFETVIYTSNDDRTMRYTDQGETNELCLCRVDLKELAQLQGTCQGRVTHGVLTLLGFDLSTAEIRGDLLYRERKFGSTTFNLRR
ncbi:hypothetical protein BS47DRAFT_1350776 [Hydnum rufescens UP504]|uniref:Actin-like ATPase domain-containing protein n=1 Tax=Hydnum rufescens UP504 TaxID=1448309 RepID=A0A9P6ALM5_9AGAM|nr:hypothetical protein BS47DRAFT_1350776 [Hydnum rufescens UP504]